MDSASARDLSNYILSQNGAKYDTASAVAGRLQSSPAVQTGNVLHVTEFNATTNTVTFKLATALANADKFSIDVKNGVLSADKQSKVAKYTDTTKTFTDTAAPKLLSTSINSAGKLKLVFDEPINTTAGIGVVKVDDVTVYDPAGPLNTAPTISQDTGDYSIILNDVLPEELVAVGTHRVVAYDVKDTVASPQTNTAAVVTGSYTISTDVTPPAVSKVTQSKNDSRSFEIEFSEPVKYSDFANSVALNQASFIIKKGNTTFTLGVSDANYGVTQKDSKTWKITFVADGSSINPLYGKDETSANLSYELAGYKDAANNVGNKATGNVTISKEMGAPTIKPGLENKISNSNGGQLVVKFDKNVTAVGTLDKSKVKVTDKDGISRAVSTVALQNNDELLITLDGFSASSPANDKAPFTVTLSPGLVKSAENVQNTTGSVIINKDTTAAPVVAGVTSSAATNSNVNGVNVNTLTITYAQEMSASATDLSNYTLDGKALTGSQIAMNNANTVVTITLPEGFAKVDNQQLLEISKNVKTKDGSVIVKSEATKDAYTNLVTLVDNTQPTLNKAEFLVSDTATATQTKKIKLTFSESIGNLTSNAVTIADLAVVIGGSEQRISSVANGASNDKEVVIELADNIAVANTVDVKVVGVTTDNPAIDIKDKKQNVAKAGTVRVNGKVLDTDAISNNANFAASTVTGVSAADVLGAGNDGELKVDWTALSNATSYKVEYKAAAGTWTTATTSATGTTYTITGLIDGTAYDVRVTGNNGSVDSTVSTTVNATPEANVPATAGTSVGSVAIADDVALAALTTSENGKDLIYTVDTVAKTYTVADTVTTKADFLTALNAVLGTDATASFNASNQLVVTSATTGSTSTVVATGAAANALVGSPTETAGVNTSN